MDMTLTPESQPWAVPGLCRLTYTSLVDGASDWALLLPPPEVTSETPLPPKVSPEIPGVIPGAGAGDVPPAHLACGYPADTWIINLHGHGSTGDQLYTRQDIRQNWLPYFERHGYSILTPNLRGNAWMSPAAVADLHALIQRLKRGRPSRRFFLVSGSMGGTGSLIYACVHPQDIAGVVALCPAADLPGYHLWCGDRLNHPIIRQIHQAISQSYRHDPQAIANHSAVAHADQLTMPVFVVHGDADPLIPVGQAQQLDQAMQGRPNFRYLQLPGGNHDAPLWLMSQGLDWVRQQLTQ